MDTSALILTRTWFEEHLREALERARKTGHPEWFAKSLSIPPIPVIPAFARYQGFGWLFCPPNGSVQLGLGLSREWQWQERRHWEGMDRHARRLTAAGVPPEAWVVGGQAFSPQSAWPDWPSFYLGLPTVQISQTPAEATLTVVLPIQGDWPPEAYQQRLEPIWQALFGTFPATVEPIGRPVATQSNPSRDAWMRLVADGSAAIRAGDLDKVVLARELQLSYPDGLPVRTVLDNLIAQNPDAVIFALRHQDSVFLGATPELLATVRDGQVETMCLAGSAPRGLTPEEDAQWADAMQRDPKIVREHAVVRRHVAEALAPFTRQLSMAETPELKRLPTVQHLCTPVRGPLDPDASIWPVVAELQPTPAVAGYPVAEATQYLVNHEPFRRGWYAGTIGWSNLAGDGQWMVALRSALLHNTGISLYAGCGIMGDSDPEAELRESDWKMNTMLSALELEGESL